MDKHVLFYSNFCQFSKELIGEILKKNLRPMFVLISVDQNKHSLPPFVDRVPMIVSNKKELVYDDALHPFLDSLYKKDDNREILPFMTMTSRGAFSDTFSFVDDQSSPEYGMPIGFVFLGQEDKINTPKDEERQNGRFDQNMLEKLNSQRDLDIQRIIQMKPRPV